MGEHNTRQVWGIRLLMLVLLASSVWWGLQVIQNLRAAQEMRLAQAELENVQYGLLDAQAWVDEIMAILDRRIRNLDLGPENRAALQASFARMLDTLIREVDAYMRSRNQEGNWWQRFQGAMRQSVQDVLVDLQGLRQKAPDFAAQILLELDKPGAREELSRVLRGMLQDVSASTFQPVDRSRIEDIQYAYHCVEVHFCRGILQAKLQHKKDLAERQILYLWLSVGLMLLLTWRQRIDSSSLPLLATFGGIAVLMTVGVLAPMLEVEARITDLSLRLLDEKIHFRDQVLYFQSKSVTDIVQVMLATGEARGITVGVLVMTFSVLFPLAKVLAATGVLHAPPWVANNTVVQFFALKSAKWSMADVMVVAILMAYLGFDGLMDSQLDKLAGASTTATVLTTNGTQLQPGFYVFFAFCLASLLTSVLLERALASRRQG